MCNSSTPSLKPQSTPPSFFPVYKSNSKGYLHLESHLHHILKPHRIGFLFTYCFMMLRPLKQIMCLFLDSNLVSSIAAKKRFIKMFQNGPLYLLFVLYLLKSFQTHCSRSAGRAWYSMTKCIPKNAFNSVTLVVKTCYFFGCTKQFVESQCLW